MLTYANAIPIFASVSGTRFIGINSRTQVPLTGGKKNPHMGRVIKVTTGSNVMVFAQSERSAYSAQVKRRMEDEGLDPTSWDSGPLPFGEWVDNTVFITHTKKGDTVPTFYLRVHFVKPGKSTYLLDGNPIAKADIIGMPERKEGTQGGQTEKVIPRNYKLENITEIRVDGATHTF